MNFKTILGLSLILLFLFQADAQMQKLRIADNHHFLVKEDGQPFVWIGETNWFFAKLPPATIDSILDVRSSQGYTIMFVSCREKLHNGDGPGRLGNPNEAWWSYLDEYISKCRERNLYVGITLGWWGIIRSHSAEDLYEYGKWVGNRYKDDNNIVWLTAGETGSHSRKSMLPDDKVKALVQGIRDGDMGNKLLTIHADYKRGTSLSNHANLSDFNNWQTSQWCCIDDLPRKDDRNWTVWEAIQYDYEKLYEGKPKPTLDSEAWYENNKDFCGTTPFNIRRRAYFTIFAGSFGHTYGAGGIWDGLLTNEKCSKSALDAIAYKGAEHIGYVSNFLHRLGDDFLKLRPAQSLIVSDNSDNYEEHIQASVAEDSTFALIYSASDLPYELSSSTIKGRKISGIWYNPRTDQYSRQSKVVIDKLKGISTFDPPGEMGAGNDWVLILGGKKVITQLAKN